MNITELATWLKLGYVNKNFSELIKDDSLSHEEVLLQLLTGEYESRLRNGINRRIRESKFPQKKYLVDFDRTKYPKDFLPEFEELETLDFIEKNENVILIGTPGAGKTHYSIGLRYCCLYGW